MGSMKEHDEIGTPAFEEERLRMVDEDQGVVDGIGCVVGGACEVLVGVCCSANAIGRALFFSTAQSTNNWGSLYGHFV